MTSEGLSTVHDLRTTMRRVSVLLCASVAGLLLLSCRPTPAADLVLQNGSIYTGKGGAKATALAVRSGRIVAVGTDGEMASLIGDATEVRDLSGQMVLPGLHDLHIHALGIVPPNLCDLGSTARSLDEMVPFLKTCMDRFQPAPGEWLDVLQWAFSAGNNPSDRFPTMRAALDAVSTEHPIFLWGDDGHHGAANSLALKSAGIDSESLGRDFRHLAPFVATDGRGEPTGGVSEIARTVVRPDFGDDMLGGGMPNEELMPRVAERLAASGITTILDPFVNPGTLDSYAWLEASGGMTFRLRAAFTGPTLWSTGIDGDVDTLPKHFEALAAARDRFDGSSLIRADAIKLFADAVLEGNQLADPPTQPVAAMLDGFLQPRFEVSDAGARLVGYVNPDSDVCRQLADGVAVEGADADEARRFRERHGFHMRQCLKSYGVLEHSEEYIHEYVRQATEAGFHSHIHALADRGVRVAVDALEKVKTLADSQGLSQSLAHLQVIHPDDVQRIGELDIATVFTFVWATPDPEYERMVIPFIDEVQGEDDLYNPQHYYMKNVYPARSLLKAGGLVVAGSDAPVGSRDPMPFTSLEQAITRSAGELELNRSQGLSVHEAIAAFTTSGAQLMGHEDELGSLEVGKVADLIVIDQDIVALAQANRAEDISETQVTLTVFDGRIVFEAP